MASRFSSPTSALPCQPSLYPQLFVDRVIFRHGAQSVGDGASKSTLENEFGTANEDECIIKILESGNMQESEVGRTTTVSKERID